MTTLREARQALWESVEGLSGDQLQQRVGESWSVLGNIEHLYAMEIFVAEALRGVLQAPAGEAAAPKDLGSLLDRSVKYNAPPFGHPSGKIDSLEEARQRLEESLVQLETVFSSVPESQEGSGYSMPHPVYGILSAAQWEELLALHILRHSAQIEELRSELAS
ncbi:hypothetical protein J2T17_004296 [Paenibacillus mucilaginosus]|uniref:DinB family protein n=1 Tax=Paenibacillus mucilaginosus TaxID=61624 RepID=UPI003D196DD3